MKAFNTIRQIPHQIQMNRTISNVFKNEKITKSIRKANHINRIANIQAGYSPEPTKISFMQKIINLIKK